MFGRNYIDGSVEWVGIPDLLRNDVPPWTANILAPYHSWGYQGPSINLDWGSGFGGNSNSISVLWSLPTRVLPIYHWRVFEIFAVLRAGPVMISLERTIRTACKVLPLAATPSAVVLVNQQDDGWDDLWYEPVGK